MKFLKLRLVTSAAVALVIAGMGSATAVVISKTTTFTASANVTAYYNIPSAFPSPNNTADSQNQSLADMAANPQNYIGVSPFTVTMPAPTGPTDPNNVDIWTNDATLSSIGIIQTGTPALVPPSSSGSTQQIGFDILYTPCGTGATQIDMNQQCTGANGCADTNIAYANCQAAPSQIRYKITPPPEVLAGNTTYAVSPDFNITYIGNQ